MKPFDIEAAVTSTAEQLNMEDDKVREVVMAYLENYNKIVSGA